MSIMSGLEGRFCRSATWENFARRSVLPWATASHSWSGTVLEIGGGTGAMADELLHRQREIDQLLLVDIDPTMTGAARTRLADRGGRAVVFDSDGGPFPASDSTVDTVCSWLMLHHVLEWEAMLRDIHRVLRPGGWFIGYDLTQAPLGRALHRVSRSEYRLIDPSELHQELDDIGFIDIAVTPALLGQLMTVRARRMD